jgi:hypothetical protein
MSVVSSGHFHGIASCYTGPLLLTVSLGMAHKSPMQVAPTLSSESKQSALLAQEGNSWIQEFRQLRSCPANTLQGVGLSRCAVSAPPSLQRLLEPGSHSAGCTLAWISRGSQVGGPRLSPGRLPLRSAGTASREAAAAQACTYMCRARLEVRLRMCSCSFPCATSCIAVLRPLPLAHTSTTRGAETSS